MKFLISVKNHEEYIKVVKDYKIPIDLPTFIPDTVLPSSGVRKDMRGWDNETLVLVGNFSNEEYEYLLENSCTLYVLDKIYWGDLNAKK